MAHITRRNFIKLSGSAAALGALGLPDLALSDGHKKVVVVGGGIGGATAAKYIKRADSSIDVTLIEANRDYYTCFLSNEVLSGERDLDSVKFGYGGLHKYGIKVVYGKVTAIDADKQSVALANFGW